VNVGTVRARIRTAGEIVRAEPVTTPGGLLFAFQVTSADPDFAAKVGSDGLSVEPGVAPPAAAPVAPAEPPAVVSLAPGHVVRVDLARLDELMRTVGELVITRARLDGALGRVASFLPPAERRELEETSLTVERQLRDLRDGVMRVRLVPVRDVFARMRLVVRDLTRDADLVLTGEATEIDKFVVERLADPLLHLVRNAVSHGLEPPRSGWPPGSRRAGGSTCGRRPPAGRWWSRWRTTAAGSTRSGCSPARGPPGWCRRRVGRPGRGARPDLRAGASRRRTRPTGRAAAGSGWTWCGGRSRSWAARSTSPPGRGAGRRSPPACR
jgi:hypothetical protein